MRIPCLIVLLSFSLTIESCALNVGQVNQNDLLITKMIQELTPWIRTINRPLHVFHYGTRESIFGESKAPDSLDPRVRNYVTKVSDQFWDEPKPCDPCTYGDGLYAASDPQYSGHFGGPDWALIKIALRPGTRYINADRAMLSEASIKTLGELGCTRPDPYRNGIYGGRLPQSGNLWKLFGHTKPHCHRILKKLITKLEIQVVGYYWGDGYLSPLPNCSQRKYLDLLVISKTGIDLLRTEGYTQNTPYVPAVHQVRAEINEVFKQISGGPLWDLGKNQPDPGQYAARHLFGCGSNPEDL